MTATILTAFFIICAGFFKAVADTLADHFETSIFKHKDPRFWNKAASWKYVRYVKVWFIKTKYRPDGWHLANSAMILSFLLFGITEVYTLHWFNQILYDYGCGLAIYGSLFILSFNTFYDHILKAKT